MSGPLKILIVRVGAMGDVLHALPAVAGLRAALPDAYIGWAIEPRWTALLRGPDGSMPVVDRVHAVNTKAWRRQPFAASTMRQIAAMRREMGAERYHLCVDLQGSLKSGVVGWMSGARRRVGPAEPRERAARMFYDERIATHSRSVIAQAADLLGLAAGLWVPASKDVLAPMVGYTREEGVQPRNVTLPRDAEAEAWAERLVAGAGRVALLAPTAGWGAKEWGVERFASLAAALREDGLRVMVNGVPGAAFGVAERVGEVGGVEVVRASLPELIALTRRVALVVGGDTGPVHLAAALGRPVVALFGPTDPMRNGPDFVGARVRVLRDSASLTDHTRRAETEAGLARITVEEVLRAAGELVPEERMGMDGR